MKRTTQTTIGLMALALLALGAATSQAASPPPLQANLSLRSLTRSDIGDYQLPAATQISGGLNVIGLGEPAYLEAWVNIAIPASDIQSVTWALTDQPLGSTAVLTNSPLGTNVPIAMPADQLAYQIAGRSFLRPDVRGQYTVSVTIATGKSGTTNLTQTITAGTFMGVNTCALCHSGGLIAPNKVIPWEGTLHASKFTRGINGKIAGYGKGCISCHTVGYDTNPLAVNGGFDDIASQLGWTFPTVLTNGNFESMPSQLQNVANIQCENCHGPGSEHAMGLGDTNKIAVSISPQNCAQCHDAKTHHIKIPEWKNSKHAIPPRIAGASRAACLQCHTSRGFIAKVNGTTVTDTTYEPIGCTTCHEPHDATNPHQLRKVDAVTLADGTTVSGYGNAQLCMNCHHTRMVATDDVIQKYQQGLPTWVGGSSLSPMGPQADMFMGVGGVTYGQSIPSSAHRNSVTNACVTCHMQPTPDAKDPAFLLGGGHTFNVIYKNGTTNIQMTGACTPCHGPTSTLNLVREDFNGDGVIEGVQTEVQHLLDKLSTMLPPDNTVKSNVSVKTNWTVAQIRAAWNWKFVSDDRSLGVHNAAYAVGLLKASIADLTGDANNDGLPDSWQVQYFGSASSPNAAPNATPAGDGVPNWLKYSLGLDPTKAGTSLPGGYAWINGTTLGSSSATNTVQIYTAAEVAFGTEVGKTYQIQGISSLSGGWQNIGSPITGTGSTISYVTPTRANAQQYFRVVHD